MTKPITFGDKLTAWIELTRFDKPIGTELLLYPTLWALFLASFGTGELPSGQLVMIFTLGAVLMRAAGCAINDFADRKVDGRVIRTKNRPLADGRLSAKTAVITFVGLSLVASSLLLFLPKAVFFWALVALVLAFVYPFMKRHTHLPQVVLAAAFGWAVPMAYVATTSVVDVWGWLVFVAYMCWTVAYDTEYAMCDKEDDLNIGIKSTAILFGSFDVQIVMGLFGLFVLLMGLVFWHYFGIFGSVGILPVVLMVYRQYQKIRLRQRLDCFGAFLDNRWVGRWLFLWTLCCVWANL